MRKITWRLGWVLLVLASLAQTRAPGKTGLAAAPALPSSASAGAPAPASTALLGDYQALYQEGVVAYQKKDAETALQRFGQAEPYGRNDWRFLKDLYWQWAATYRDLKKDNGKALEYYRKCVEVSQDLSEWPAYWAIYMQGVIAFENGDAGAALQSFSRAELYGQKEWTFMNDLYWYWGATYRDLKKDNAKALEYYRQSEKVSQDLSESPAYWAVYMQGVIAYENRDAKTALERFSRIEPSGKKDRTFMNNLYWYWAATYRELEKDNIKALELYQKCVDASPDPSVWPGYRAIYLTGVIALENGDKAAALINFDQAEKYGKNDPAFLKEVHKMRETINPAP